jgi:hypothetical protein
MEPVVDGLQQEYAGRLQFSVYKDSSSSNDLIEFSIEQGVEYVPTMMLVSPSGVELNRWIGTTSGDVLREAFEANL